jgi:hypothetical protein
MSRFTPASPDERHRTPFTHPFAYAAAVAG